MAAKPRIGKREAAYLAGEDATDVWAQMRSDTRFTRALVKRKDDGEDYPPRLLYLVVAAVLRSIETVPKRRRWKTLQDKVEAYADGQATILEIEQVYKPHRFDASRLVGPTTSAAADEALADALLYLLDDPKTAIEGVRYVTDAMGYVGAVKAGDLANDDIDGDAVWGKLSFQQAKKAHERRLCGLIRDIFGNPYRPVAFDPKWRTEAATGIALKMYDEKMFAAMPILADALEEAGCDSEAILSHCREPGTHVRGCWVVDSVLGKE